MIFVKIVSRKNSRRKASNFLLNQFILSGLIINVHLRGRDLKKKQKIFKFLEISSVSANLHKQYFCVFFEYQKLKNIQSYRTLRRILKIVLLFTIFTRCYLVEVNSKEACWPCLQKRLKKFKRLQSSRS